MTLNAAVLDALRDAFADQPEWVELRCVQRHAAQDPDRSYRRSHL